MTLETFAHYHGIWARYIRRAARRLSRDDRDLADDMEQEALCKLLELDLSPIRTNVDGYIRNTICACMRDVARAERRARVIVAWTPQPAGRGWRHTDPRRTPVDRNKRTDSRGRLRDAPVRTPGVPREQPRRRDDIPAGPPRQPPQRTRRQTLPVLPQPRRVPRHPNWAAPHEGSA